MRRAADDRRDRSRCGSRAPAPTSESAASDAATLAGLTIDTAAIARRSVLVVSGRVGTELSAAAASRAARFPRRADHARCAARAGGAHGRFAERAASRRARGRMAGARGDAGRARAGVSCARSATSRCRGPRSAGRPKRTLFNFYFTRVSIDGMTGPFFLETLANGTLLPFERAATVAHEWSHLAGYADESEANFVGWLVCMRGPAPVQYSGWLSLYGTVVGALPRSDRDELIAAARRRPARRSPRDFRSHSAARGSGGQPRRLRALRSISESEQSRGGSTELWRGAAPVARDDVQ